MSSCFIQYWQTRLNFLDVHYHAAPDAFVRRHGVLESGRRYRDLGGGVVLKSHLGSCVQLAEAAREFDLPVFGSVVLNAVSGGPRRKPVMQALSQVQSPWSGRLLVHLPTFTGAKHASKLVRCTSNRYAEQAALEPCRVTDESGRLLTELIDLLHMAKDHPIVISSGHSSRDEVMRLIEAAKRIGVPRLMLNQPANPMTGMKYADLLELTGEDWLYVEQTALTYLLGYQSWNDFASVLRDIPNVVYSSDLGQTSQMDIEEWRTTSQGWFETMGLSSQRIADISLTTPLVMLSP